MSVIPPAVQAHNPGGTETELYGLIALIADKKAFEKRLNDLVVAKDEARRALEDLQGKEIELANRETAAAALKEAADAKGAMYHTGLEELAAKVDQVNQERADLVRAKADFEAEMKEQRGNLEREVLRVNEREDGLPERERVAANMLAQGEHLQNEYNDKLEKLKALTGAA